MDEYVCIACKEEAAEGLCLGRLCYHCIERTVVKAIRQLDAEEKKPGLIGLEGIILTKRGREVLEQLEQKHKEEQAKTVWRLQVADFEMVMNEKHPELSEEERSKIIELARNKFSIENWEETVDWFIAIWKK